VEVDGPSLVAQKCPTYCSRTSLEDRDAEGNADENDAEDGDGDWDEGVA